VPTKSDKEQNQQRIYVAYREQDYLVPERSSDGDGSRYSGYSYYDLDFNVLGVYRNRQLAEGKAGSKCWVEEIEVGFDPAKVDEVYLVVVRYRDGGTFGSTGYWKLIGPYLTSKEAYGVEDAINKDAYGDPKKEYMPWRGYFASLTSVGVEIFRLRGDIDNEATEQS
jgi:hypothetical protein